jgi:hypothetical protein
MEYLLYGNDDPTALPSEMAQRSSSFQVFTNNLRQWSGIVYPGWYNVDQRFPSQHLWNAIRAGANGQPSSPGGSHDIL